MSFAQRARRLRLWTVFAASFSIGMLIPAAAAAQPSAEAQKLYDEGISLRAAGKHDQAADRFRRSLAIEHRPQTYLALASELFELDKTDEALAALDALYTEFDATMKPQTRAKAEKARSVVEGSLGFGRLSITIQEKGTLFVDGKEAGDLPLALSSLRLKEGPHSVRIVRLGAEPMVRDIVVVKGEMVTIEVPVVPPASTPPPAKPVEPAPPAVQAPPPPHPKPAVNPKTIQAQAVDAPKPVSNPKSPMRVYLGGHVALMGGLAKTDNLAEAPPTTCGVYCLPSLSLLAGIDGGVSIQDRILLRAGVEYMHASSTLHVAWPRPGFAFADGVADATMNLDHAFALNGGLAHLGIGANAPLGKHLRLEGSIGAGAFIGQSTETVSGTIQAASTAMQTSITPVTVAEVTQKTETFVLPVLRPHLGVSLTVGRVWLGIAAEGVLSFTKGPSMCKPQVSASQTTLEASSGARIDEVECSDGTGSGRPFGRIFIISPAATVGASF